MTAPGRRLTMLTAAALLAAAPAAAQVIAEQPTARYRDPTVATYWGIIPGGGQLYAGEYDRGFLLLGGSLGAMALGAHASRFQCTSFDRESPTGFDVIQTCERHRAWLLFGGAAAAGLWLAGLFDAADSAERANFRNGWTAVVPRLDVGMDREGPVVQLGIAIHMR